MAKKPAQPETSTVPFSPNPLTGNWFKQSDGSLRGYWMTAQGQKLTLLIDGDVSSKEIRGAVGRDGGRLLLGAKATDGSRVGVISTPDGEAVRVRSVPHRDAMGNIRNVFIHAVEAARPANLGKDDF